jgi:hypothetical protein
MRYVAAAIGAGEGEGPLTSPGLPPYPSHRNPMERNREGVAVEAKHGAV